MKSMPGNASVKASRARHSVRAASTFCGLFIRRRRARSDAPYLLRLLRKCCAKFLDACTKLVRRRNLTHE